MRKADTGRLNVCQKTDRLPGPYFRMDSISRLKSFLAQTTGTG